MKDLLNPFVTVIFPLNQILTTQYHFSVNRVHLSPDYPGNLLSRRNAFLQGMKNITGY